MRYVLHLIRLLALPIFWHLEDGLSSVEREEYIGTINKNSELLLKLINDILELSRIESGYMSFSF